LDSPDPVFTPDRSGPDYELSLAEETYVQLRNVAHRQLRKRGGPASIQTTDLVHRAYDRLDRHAGQWESRAHFLAVAGKAMWQILVDHARERSAKKRGGDHHRVSVSIAELYATPRSVDVLNLEETMTRLGSLDAVQGRLVELKIFAGLQMAEIAEILAVSKSTAEAEWRHARAWLRKELVEAQA